MGLDLESHLPPVRKHGRERNRKPAAGDFNPQQIRPTGGQAVAEVFDGELFAEGVHTNTGSQCKSMLPLFLGREHLLPLPNRFGLSDDFMDAGWWVAEVHK